MKTAQQLFGKFAIISALCFSLFSCSKDNSNSNEGVLHFNDTTYSLAQSILLDYGAITGGLYKYQLEIYSSGLQYDASVTDLRGTGNRLSLKLISSQSKFPKLLTYTFNPSGSFVDSTIDMGTFYKNYEGTSGIADSTFTVDGGSITLERNSDSSYNVTVNLSMFQGKPMTGNYKGSIQHIDWEK